MTLTEFSQKLHVFSLITPPVLLCVGSTKLLTDCYGPLVGTLLTERYATLAYVYGTLKKPIHALNLTASLAAVKAKHPYAKIVAIDSFVAKSDHRPLLAVDGGIRPGLASGKNLPAVGDLSLIGRTQNGSKKADLGQIYSLALTTAELLQNALACPLTAKPRAASFCYETGLRSDLGSY